MYVHEVDICTFKFKNQKSDVSTFYTEHITCLIKEHNLSINELFHAVPNQVKAILPVTVTWQHGRPQLFELVNLWGSDVQELRAKSFEMWGISEMDGTKTFQQLRKQKKRFKTFQRKQVLY